MTADSGQTILEETCDEDFMPTAEELEACAKMLEIDLDKEPYLTKLVHDCLTASLPESWKACADQQGNLYYFNFSTGDSSWEHPCDALYRRLAIEERRRFTSGSGDPNGLATNPPPDVVSLSEKEIVTETSPHMESNDTCHPLDNGTREDSTGYHTASDDMWSAHEAAYRETYRPVEEGEFKSKAEHTLQEVADEGSRPMNCHKESDLNKTENEVWTLGETRSIREATASPDTVTTDSMHFLFEMNKSKKQSGWTMSTSAEEPCRVEAFEACLSIQSEGSLYSHSIVDQVREGKGLDRALLHCEDSYSEENSMTEFNESDELSERIRTTIDHLLKNTHLSNSENAKIKELVNSLRERTKSEALKNKLKERKTDEKEFRMPVRQPYRLNTIPSMRNASDFPVSPLITVKNRVREKEVSVRNFATLREGKPNSINPLRMAIDLSEEAWEPKSTSPGRGFYDYLAMRDRIIRSELFNLLDNEHSTEQPDLKNEEERRKRDMGVSSSSQKESKVPGTFPSKTQHDNDHSPPEYHTINRLFANNYMSPSSLSMSQVQASRDLEMRISNQRRWFQKFQRKVASRDFLF